MSDVIVLGRDAVGIVAESEGMRYYLTECCAASAKGLENYIGCRKCYAEIDPALGGLPDQESRLKPGGDITKFSDWEYVAVPLRLTQVFGDGIPYDEFVARRNRPTETMTGRVIWP